jgi:cold shock protein
MWVMEATKTVTPVVEAEGKKNGNTVEGTVKSFDVGKGYGFISQDGVTKEVFVHQEAIMGENNRNLAAGDRVSFEVTEGPKGPRAASVNKI